MKTPQQHRTFARTLAAGAGVTRALTRAGYSPAQASKGWAIVKKSSGLQEAIAEQRSWLCELGRSMTAQQQVELVRGRLALNTIQGCDRGVGSARALGSEKRVAMFTPDAVAGIIVVEAPKDFTLPKHLPKGPLPDE